MVMMVLVWAFFATEKVMLIQILVRKEQGISFGVSLPATRYVSDVC